MKEYWIIDPKTRMLEKHVLENGKYSHEWFDSSAPVPVSIFPGFEIDLTLVFGEEETNA